MDYWSPIFSKIVDSSIWCEPDHVRLVWITMLAKKDKDHVVRANAFMIAKWANKTEAEVLDALKVLASPDTKRIEPQPYEGRRIEKVDSGWKILNGQRYQDAIDKLRRNLYQADWQAGYRERKKQEVAAGVAPKKVSKRGQRRREGGYSADPKEASVERIKDKWEADDRQADMVIKAAQGVQKPEESAPNF